MSHDLPIPRQDSRTEGPAVVEWGGETRSRPRRVWSLAGLGRNHRLPAVFAGLGAVAALTSLLAEWVVMTVPNSGPEGNTTVRLPGGVSEVGGLGLGYLIGLLALTGTVALALRGTATVRHNARVLGLALVAALFGVLVATASSLDDSTERMLFSPGGDDVRMEYGRGLAMAFAAIALLGLCLQLAGRDVAAEGATAPGADGKRRRRPRRDEAEEGPPPPTDLTVEPTAPFAHPEPPGHP